MAFTINCSKCNKQFKTGYSAKKHYDHSHYQHPYQGGIFRDSRGQALVNQPKALQLDKEEMPHYKMWLALVAEEIVGSLTPSGKGEKFTDFTKSINPCIRQWNSLIKLKLLV